MLHTPCEQDSASYDPTTVSITKGHIYLVVIFLMLVLLRLFDKVPRLVMELATFVGRAVSAEEVVGCCRELEGRGGCRIEARSPPRNFDVQISFRVFKSSLRVVPSCSMLRNLFAPISP